MELEWKNRERWDDLFNTLESWDDTGCEFISKCDLLNIIKTRELWGIPQQRRRSYCLKIVGSRGHFLLTQR